MAETDDHRDEIGELVFTLKRHFRGRDDVYVSGNNFVYYEEGNREERRAPLEEGMEHAAATTKLPDDVDRERVDQLVVQLMMEVSG